MAQPQTLVLPSATNETGGLERGSIFFIGTATVILKYAGFTILTDPNFLHQGDHVHLGYGLTSERLTEPAMNIESLPPLDLVLLSHYHGDHFDRIAEEKLDKRLPVITTRHAAAALRGKGFSEARGLETWESFTAVKRGVELSITSMPGKHAPGPLALLLPPVMGSLLEFRQAADGSTTPLLRFYITGDTLMHSRLKEIPARYPEIDVMLIHLGGTRILGVMLTMDGEQGVEAIKLINPRTAVPIHYDDYTVFKSPLEEFSQAVIDAGLASRVVYLKRGEIFNFEVAAGRLR